MFVAENVESIKKHDRGKQLAWKRNAQKEHVFRVHPLSSPGFTRCLLFQFSNEAAYSVVLLASHALVQLMSQKRQEVTGGQITCFLQEEKNT